MSFNRGDVRADVRIRLEEFNTTVITDADINQEFDYALIDITNQIDLPNLLVSDTTSLDTVADQTEYTLPTTNGVIRKIMDIKIGDIHYEEISFLDRDNVSTGSGVSLGDTRRTSHAYYLFGTTTIGFVPAPSSVKDVEFYYFRDHPTITDDTTALSLPDLARKAVVTRITATVMKADETIPNVTIQTELFQYDRYMAELRFFVENRSIKKLSQFTNY